MTGALLARFPKYTSPDDMVERLTRSLAGFCLVGAFLFLVTPTLFLTNEPY